MATPFQARRRLVVPATGLRLKWPAEPQRVGSPRRRLRPEAVLEAALVVLAFAIAAYLGILLLP